MKEIAKHYGISDRTFREIRKYDPANELKYLNWRTRILDDLTQTVCIERRPRIEIDGDLAEINELLGILPEDPVE